MFNLDMFTKKSIASIDIAVNSAERLGHTYVGTEHMVMGLLHEGSNVAATVLKGNGIKFKTIYNEIIEIVGHGEQTTLDYDCMTPALSRILSASVTTSPSEASSAASWSTAVSSGSPMAVVKSCISAVRTGCQETSMTASNS